MYKRSVLTASKCLDLNSYSRPKCVNTGRRHASRKHFRFLLLLPLGFLEKDTQELTGANLDTSGCRKKARPEKWESQNVLKIAKNLKEHFIWTTYFLRAKFVLFEKSVQCSAVHNVRYFFVSGKATYFMDSLNVKKKTTTKQQNNITVRKCSFRTFKTLYTFIYKASIFPIATYCLYFYNPTHLNQNHKLLSFSIYTHINVSSLSINPSISHINVHFTGKLVSSTAWQ